MLRNPLYVYGDADVSVPSSLNLGRLMLDSFWKFGENIALLNGSSHEKLTYQEMLRNSINVALSLYDMGIRKGDVIAICSENRQEFFSTLVGIICTGATVTTINELYSQEEFIHVLNISKPKMMFCSPLAYKIHMKTIINEKLDLIMFGKEKISNAKLYENFVIDSGISYRDFEVIEVDGRSDTVFLMYSSATTGLPKGVMLTHLNIVTLCNLPLPILDIKLESYFSITKWSNNLGLFGGIITFFYGSTYIYLPEFQSDLHLETIEKYRITRIMTVPSILETICKNQNNNDVSSVSAIFSGVSLLRDDIVQAAKNRFPNLKYIVQGYGMTEVSLGITSCSYNITSTCCVTMSVGRIVGPTIVKIIDIQTKKILGPNQPGEICIKGSTVMKGYVNKNRSDDFDSEGFFRTGDMGYYDDNKYFYILNRLQDLIKQKDCKVAPIEIEETLFKHPFIRDVTVIGVPNNGAEAPCAFVVARSKNKLTEDEVTQFVAERSPVSKHLQGGVIFVDEIPRYISGKVSRTRLREMFKEIKGI